MYKDIQAQAGQAMKELIVAAGMKPGQIMVVGCSSSEMVGDRIGQGSSVEAAQAAYAGIAPVLREAGVYLAAQCCEHLNRALVIQREVAFHRGLEIVNAVPQPKAGGSFATAVYGNMADPVLVESIQADAGMDIGGTLIGMHLRRVAVPVRLSLKRIGLADIICARTRPMYIGGPRASYLPL